MNLFYFFSQRKNYSDLIQALENARSLEPNPLFRQELRDKLHNVAQLRYVDEIELHHSSYERLVFWIKQMVCEIELSEDSRTHIRERLFAFIERSPVSLRSFFLKKHIFAGAVFLTMFFLLVIPLLNSSSRIFSDVLLQLEGSGQITIVRDGRSLFLRKNDKISLNKGDILHTDADVVGSINFYDDVIVRLDNNTSLLIHEILPSSNEIGGMIKIELQDGEIWSNVVGLGSGISRFSAVAGTVAIASVGRASFDVSKEQDQVLVVVTDRVVDVSLSGHFAYKMLEKTLVAGYGMYVFPDFSVDTFELAESERYVGKWFAHNRSLDKKLIGEISQKKVDVAKETAGILPNHPLYSLAKSLPEQTQLALTFDDVAREKVSVDFAAKRLIEAQALILDGEEDTAVSTLEEFQRLSENVILSANEFEQEGDQDKADELRAYMDSKLQRTLISLNSSTELYKIKPWIQEIQVQVPHFSDPISEEDLRSKQMSQLLSHIQDLINKSDYSDVGSLFDTYRSYASLLSERFSLDFQSDFSLVRQLLTDRVNDLSFLLVIRDSLSSKDLLRQQARDLEILILAQVRSMLEELNVHQDTDLPRLALVQKMKRLTIHNLDLEILDALKESVEKLSS